MSCFGNRSRGSLAGGGRKVLADAVGCHRCNAGTGACASRWGTCVAQARQCSFPWLHCLMRPQREATCGCVRRFGNAASKGPIHIAAFDSPQPPNERPQSMGRPLSNGSDAAMWIGVLQRPLEPKQAARTRENPAPIGEPGQTPDRSRVSPKAGARFRRYFFSLRYSKTWSMMPYSLACSAVRILSRSVSRRTCSAV